jgi:hypothetical protein
MRSLISGVVTMLLVASSARADALPFPGVSPVASPSELSPNLSVELSAGLFAARPIDDPSQFHWWSDADEATPIAATRPLALAPPGLTDDGQPLHQAAVEHSDGYQMRAKIHKYASFATLPLFAAEVALGQSLYNTPANAGSKRGAHAVVGAGIVGLFGVNTLTGAWNMFGEGRRDPDGRALRLVHGLLMMAADVGFLATTAAAPSSEGQRGALTFESDKVTHRNLAIASISVGTAGYLLMLLGGR